MYRFFVNLCLVALHMGSNSLKASPAVDGDYVFFGRTYYEMPLSCREMSFCFDKGVDYPTSTVEKLLDEMNKAITNRLVPNLGYDSTYNDDCPVNDTFSNKPIYYILDESDNVRVVAQSEKFQQYYSVKWCQRPGRITVDTPTFVKGSQTLIKNRIECVNQYIMDADFLVLSDEDDELEFARPKGGIPVWCRCRYTKLD